MRNILNPFTGRLQKLWEDLNNLGWYVDPAALNTAHPTGTDGQFAIVGSTDTVWVWDTTTTAWINSTLSGTVSTVFGRTGVVTAQTNDYTLSQINGINAITLDYAFDNGKIIDGANSLANAASFGDGTDYIKLGSYDIIGSNTSNLISSSAITLFGLGDNSIATDPMFIFAGADTTALRSPKLRLTGWDAGGLGSNNIDFTFSTVSGGNSTIETSTGNLELKSTLGTIQLISQTQVILQNSSVINNSTIGFTVYRAPLYPLAHPVFTVDTLNSQTFFGDGASTNYLTVEHNGTNAELSTNSGDLILNPNSDIDASSNNLKGVATLTATTLTDGTFSVNGGTITGSSMSASQISAAALNIGANAFTVNSIEIVGSDGEVNAAAIEDKFLRNDGDDTTTGKLTMAGADLNSNDLTNVKNIIDVQETITFDAEYDNGNSGSADTVNWGNGNKQMSTLTGNCTFTFTAPDGPCNVILRLVQDGTGSRNPVWPSSVKWSGGTEPTWSTAAASVDIVSFYYNGSTYYGQAGIGFA